MYIYSRKYMYRYTNAYVYLMKTHCHCLKDIQSPLTSPFPISTTHFHCFGSTWLSSVFFGSDQGSWRHAASAGPRAAKSGGTVKRFCHDVAALHFHKTCPGPTGALMSDMCVSHLVGDKRGIRGKGMTSSETEVVLLVSCAFRYLLARQCLPMTANI